MLRLACCAFALSMARSEQAPVVVAGATGRVGSGVMRALAVRGTPAHALARDGAKAREMGHKRVLEADYGDAAALDAAFAQVGAPFRLFLGCANSPRQAEYETNVLSAAVAHGCEYVVKLSTATAVLSSRAGPYAAHVEIETALEKSGVAHAILRPSLYMQMLDDGPLGLADALADSDSCEHLLADAPIAAVDARDVSDAGAALLATWKTDGPRARILEITGPAAVRLGVDAADAISELRQRRVTVRGCSAVEHCESRGVPAVAAPFFETLASGCADVSSEVPELLGRPARSLREYIREKAHTFAPRAD